jgi:hypothetical protein
MTMIAAQRSQPADVPLKLPLGVAIMGGSLPTATD